MVVSRSCVGFGLTPGSTLFGTPVWASLQSGSVQQGSNDTEVRYDSRPL